MKLNLNLLNLKQNTLLLGAKNPGEIAKSIMDDFGLWVKGGAVSYATFQFMLGCISYMSKEPQKHSAGKDHMTHAAMGLVGVFVASTVMSYLETKSMGWV